MEAAGTDKRKAKGPQTGSGRRAVIQKGGIVMGIVGLIIFVIIACIVAIFSPSEENNSVGCRNTDHFNIHNDQLKQYRYRRRSEESEFEPSGSYYDKDGNEHEVDDDGYCEECDDYHE